jgi:putative hemolysin
MLTEVLIDLLILLLLALANGFFAMAEIALVSSRPTRLQERADRGDAGAAAALEATADLNSYLSTIQIGITLIGIYAGVFGGTTLARIIAASLAEVPSLTLYAQTIAIVIVVIGTTYLTLVVGELVPKRIALGAAEDIAARVARPMRLLSRLVSPMVKILSLSTEGILKVIPVGQSSEPPVTEEEIRLLMERGTKAGVLDQAERDIVDRTLRLDDFKVDAIMTPGTQIKWLDLDDDPQTLLVQAIEGGRTRYPVCRGTLDNVVGAVRVRDLFAQVVDNGGETGIDLEQIMFKPLFIVESMPALNVLELFREYQTHLAIVLDEFGAVEGMVTLQDFLEEIVGDLPAYMEEAEPSAIEREDGSWLVDGLMPISDFINRFDLPEQPADEIGDYHTLAGFVVTRIGHVPSPSEKFSWGGYRFEVIDMDLNRVDKVLMTPPKEGMENEQSSAPQDMQ